MHVRPCLTPSQAGPNSTNLFHPTGAIVQVTVHGGHLAVQRKQQLLACLNLGVHVFTCTLSRVQTLQLLIRPMHHFKNGFLFENDLSGCRGLQDSTPCFFIRIHFHLVWVNLRVNHNPSSSTQLAMRGDVDENRMLIFNQSINDHGTIFQHLSEHVAGATGESAPVGKDDQRQIFTTVEITDSLRSLEGRVGKPDLTRLGFLDVLGLRVGRVSWDMALHRPCLNRDHADGNATEAPATHNYRLPPPTHVLVKASLIAETTQILTICPNSSEHVPRIVRLFAGHKSDLAVDRITHRQHWRQ
mmetsp:Transcript_92510/g.211814  ORF Transcript_92510/g.211814 Transcript_92510/m.211814 type:complete len:300 (-) Transcript_92510:5046-5945(-)